MHIVHHYAHHLELTLAKPNLLEIPVPSLVSRLISRRLFKQWRDAIYAERSAVACAARGATVNMPPILHEAIYAFPIPMLGRASKFVYL